MGALISAEVHAEYVGRVVDVFVQKVSEKTTGRSAPGGGRVQLGWETPPIQRSGRTGGDLITVFDVPASHPCDDLVGRIVPVRITGSGPLILIGEPVVDQAQGAAHPAAMVDS